MSVSLQMYHRLPPWARSVAASARGYYLNNRRYDSDTERLVNEALERDYWTSNQWKEWRGQRLSFLLQRAATKVPCYREHWTARRRNGDRSSWDYLENWPVLEKQTLRERNMDFLAEDCSRSKMFRDTTSGTTGTSLDIWSTASTLKSWYALFEARSRRWYGISKGDRWAILGGQLVTPFGQTKPPFWVWNAASKQLYMSAYHLSRDLIKHYLDALIRYRIRYVLGYSSAIYCLADEALRLKNENIQLAVAITNAEPLHEYQRSVIEAAFACPVRETYGMAEIAAAAGECSEGSLHVWPDAGVIEVGSGQGESGDLICTGLINADMPLIRYRVGDVGRLSNQQCSCGRTLPLLNAIDGRSDDVFYTSDGRQCSHIHLVLNGNPSIYESQIIQQSLANILVRYVPTEEFQENALNLLEKKIQARIGNVAVAFEKVDQIPRTGRGKFQAVVCNIPESEVSQFLK